MSPTAPTARWSYLRGVACSDRAVLSAIRASGGGGARVLCVCRPPSMFDLPTPPNSTPLHQVSHPAGLLPVLAAYLAPHTYHPLLLFQAGATAGVSVSMHASLCMCVSVCARSASRSLKEEGPNNGTRNNGTHTPSERCLPTLEGRHTLALGHYWDLSRTLLRHTLGTGTHLGPGVLERMWHLRWAATPLRA